MCALLGYTAPLRHAPYSRPSLRVMSSSPLPAAASGALISVLMVGAGEYNVGYVPTAAGAAPDKRCGVTAIVLFDLRRRGKVGRILLADADGRRLPLARACMDEKIGRAYVDMDTTVECWPKDETVAFDAGAPAAAMDSLCAMIWRSAPFRRPVLPATIAGRARFRSAPVGRQQTPVPTNWPCTSCSARPPSMTKPGCPPSGRH